MKKLLTILLLVLLPCSLRAQIQLFRQPLPPATPEVQQEYQIYNALGDELDHKIEDLRDAAYAIGATREQKLDLAAFLLKKIMLRVDRTYEENEDLMLETARLAPDNIIVETFWGDLLYFKGNYEKALEHFEYVHGREPDDMQIIGKIGLAAVQMMDYEKAIEYLGRAVNTFPDSFFILFYLGKSNYELHYFDEAISWWERARDATQDENQKAAIDEAINRAREQMASTDGSSSVEDRRFVVHFAGDSRDDLGDITFEVLNEVFYQVTRSLNFHPDVKINVIFYLTEDYYKVSRDWSAASAQGIKIMVPLKSGYKSEEYVKGLLAHEFTHTIIHLRTNNRCPLWLNEGIAQYQEFAAANGSPDEMRSDYNSIVENEFIDGGKVVKLNRVPALLNSSSRKDVLRGYISSYLATRCLADYYGERAFDTILSSLGEGKSFEEAMIDATGRDMDHFQERFEDWVRKL
ncbi:MAG: tetratricopeptide repeat protein [Candidatus Riflebacteria bacterium]|nr:tetratricopeptide repeat protein [Candidatus Riflebacteria bacterium]